MKIMHDKHYVCFECIKISCRAMKYVDRILERGKLSEFHSKQKQGDKL